LRKLLQLLLLLLNRQNNSTIYFSSTTNNRAGPSLDMQKLKNEIQALEAQMTELNEAREKLAKVNERYDKSKQLWQKRAGK
jgi:cell division protein FtsB